jgi:hypothetical protein
MIDRLEALAQKAGIAVHWTDANNRPQHVAPEALRKVLTPTSRSHTASPNWKKPTMPSICHPC